jgi:protein-glucosylgalactosylhydroxylysine glucosidase
MIVQWTALAQQAASDRHALVSRHNAANMSFDTLSSLSVGNGAFAFTVDATGLQTFPDL